MSSVMRYPERILPWCLIALLLCSASCKNNRTTYHIREFPPTTIFDSVVDMTPAYAKGFKVRYLSDGTPLIDIANPQDSISEENDTIRLALIRKGHSTENVPAGYRCLNIPIRGAVCTDLTQVSFFIGLDSVHIIKGVPSPQSQHAEQIIDFVESGDIQIIGTMRSPDIDAIRRLGADIVLVSPPLIGDKRLSDLPSTAIPVYCNLERHPLAQAEWIKLIAMLIGKETAGSDFFGKAEQHYNEASYSILEVRARPTLVLYKDNGFLKEPINTDAFMEQIIGDAGAIIRHPATAAGTSSKGSAIKEAYWQPEGKSGMLSFEETIPVAPDVLIRDLISIVHPEVIPKDSVWERRFFHPK